MGPDSMPTKDADESRMEDATAKAELAIQAILVGLEQETFRRIEYVDVDTRNFGACRVDIVLR